MPQISLDIDESTLKVIKDAATRQHVSISKWIVDQIYQKTESDYSADFKSLFGSITDVTFLKPDELSRDSDTQA